MLLPIIGMSALFAVGLTILVIAVIAIVVFYLMYHTYHGNLPSIMKLIVSILLIVGALFVISSYII